MSRCPMRTPIDPATKSFQQCYMAEHHTGEHLYHLDFTKEALDKEASPRSFTVTTPGRAEYQQEWVPPTEQCEERECATHGSGRVYRCTRPAKHEGSHHFNGLELPQGGGTTATGPTTTTDGEHRIAPVLMPKREARRCPLYLAGTNVRCTRHAGHNAKCDFGDNGFFGSVAEYADSMGTSQDEVTEQQPCTQPGCEAPLGHAGLHRITAERLKQHQQNAKQRTPAELGPLLSSLNALYETAISGITQSVGGVDAFNKKYEELNSHQKKLFQALKYEPRPDESEWCGAPTSMGPCSHPKGHPVIHDSRLAYALLLAEVSVRFADDMSLVDELYEALKQYRMVRGT